jgi:hypothetical protein
MPRAGNTSSTFAHAEEIREELLKHPVLGKQYEGEYPFQAGQPEEVRRAYAEAMGIQC